MGVKFTLVTDHKPLQFIFNRFNSKPPPRVGHWMLHLQVFDYGVLYKPGSTNIADPLSRLSVSSDSTIEVSNMAESNIRMVADQSVLRAMSHTELMVESDQCVELGLVKSVLLDGSWSRVLPSYRSVRLELSECDGLVLRGERIVVPVALRDSAVKLAHEGHQRNCQISLRIMWPVICLDRCQVVRVSWSSWTTTVGSLKLHSRGQ